MTNRTDKKMPRTARDPHHNGTAEWGWDGLQLWHRQVGERWWVKVRRTHPTRKRCLMLAQLMIPAAEMLRQNRSDELPELLPEEHWARDLL